MRGGAEEVCLPNVNEVPLGLLQQQVLTPWETILCTPFSHPHNCNGEPMPTNTARQVLRVKGRLPDGFDPPTVRNHLNTKGKAMYDEAIKWLESKLLHGVGEDRVYALGADCYLPESLEAGPCVVIEGHSYPIAPEEVEESHFNRAYVAEAFETYEDQEAVDHCIRFVDFKLGDMPAQLIFQANLKNCQGREKEIWKEHKGFEEMGWVVKLQQPMFTRGRNNPIGVEEKPVGIHIVQDMGSPRGQQVWMVHEYGETRVNLKQHQVHKARAGEIKFRCCNQRGERQGPSRSLNQWEEAL